MNIDPKAKKPLTIALILSGGLLFVGVAFFLLMSGGGRQSSSAPTKLPDMASAREVNNPSGPAIEGYASMSKSADKQNAMEAASTEGAYLPAFAPPAEDVEAPKKTPPADVAALYAQSSTTDISSSAAAEKMLSDRMRRLDALAASILTESYVPVNGGDSWLKDKTPDNAFATPQQADQEQAKTASKMLVKSGEKVFVQIDTAINTDEPSPVSATIISGAATGYGLFGTSRHNPNNTVSIEFTRMTLPSGYSVPVAAYALDPKTGRTSVSGSVDYKIFERFVLPALAAGIGKYGEIIAQQGEQTITAPLAGATTTTQSATRQQMRDAAIGAGIGQMTEVLSANAAAAKPAVTTDRNLGLEIVFMQEVMVADSKT